MADSVACDHLFDSDAASAPGGPRFLVAGIGASAGGVGALSRFFSHVPSDSRIAYVVIQHLSPDHESRLAEVLQTVSRIPVAQVRERVRIEPNRVYVVPPNASLSMQDSHLALSEITREAERRAPIDIFFRTLAESHRARAACVVLSGSGSDGSMGMKRVKEYGGICIAQDPSEAEYADMPKNAIATGLVDAVLSVAEIPARIIAYDRTLADVAPPHVPHDEQPFFSGDEQALREILRQLRVHTGHDFSNYKRATVGRRIARRMGVREVTELTDYAQLVREEPAEAEALLKDLLISVTNFFRDAHVFREFARSVVPRLFERKKSEDQLRVWVAGCATGEEAYSIAMLLAEHAMGLSRVPEIQVFASDLDEEALTHARHGYYRAGDVADVTSERLRQFFVKEGEGFRVRRELREMVLFAHHDIIKDPPFSHVDLISCRNLLIYLNRNAQARALKLFHFALNPDAYLLLGTAESEEVAGELFVALDREHHIYQARAVQARLVLRARNYEPVVRPGDRSQHWRERMRRLSEEPAPDRLVALYLHQRLLEQYASPSLVVDDNFDIVHLSERAGAYMHIPGGEPSRNVLKVIRPELRVELRTALFRAAESGIDVVARGLTLARGENRETVNIVVRAAPRREASRGGYFLVLFEVGEASASTEDSVSARAIERGEALNFLEEENARLRAQMNTALERDEAHAEELKAANEELQAINEELRSTTEELETSNEELQSVNEELQTVNQELKVKIDELSQSANDMRNLMSSTEIGTIFLDRALRVKLFTPCVCDIFNLIGADLGRSLLDITTRLTDDGLIADAKAVLERLPIVEREVQTREGRWYLMRLLPYRTVDDRIDGVVITFVEISARKAAEERLRASEERLRLTLESIPEYAIFTLDAEGRIATWNVAAEQLFGYTEAEAVGQSGAILFAPEDRMRALHEEELRHASEEGRAMDERWHVRKDGSRFFASGVLAPLRDGDALIGYTKLARDLTGRQQAEEALRRAQQELEVKVQERTRELAQANEALRSQIAERAQSEAQRIGLLRQLVSAQESERRRISRELHDQFGQQVSALTIKLAAVQSSVEMAAPLREELRRLERIARELDSDLEFFVWELRPTALDDLGLKDAITVYAESWSKHFGTPARVHVRGLDDARLPSEVETVLYRITQEALNNIAKHARAHGVDVILERRAGEVSLIIEDDGIGFDAERALSEGKGSGLGLIGMRERAALVGGSVEVESGDGTGTTIFVRIPAAPPASER